MCDLELNMNSEINAGIKDDSKVKFKEWPDVF